MWGGVGKAGIPDTSQKVGGRGGRLAREGGVLPLVYTSRLLEIMVPEMKDQM